MADNIRDAVDPVLLSNMDNVGMNILIHDPEAIRNSQCLQDELIGICEHILK